MITLPLNRPIKYKILNKVSNENTNPHKIRRMLKEKDGVRQVFLSIAKNEPTIMHEIVEDCIISRQTIYNNISILINLRIVGRRYILDIEKSKKRNYLESKMLNKFEKWSERMSPKTKRYYLTKTSMFYITEEGERLIEFACNEEGVSFTKEEQKTLRVDKDD